MMICDWCKAGSSPRSGVETWTYSLVAAGRTSFHDSADLCDRCADRLREGMDALFARLRDSGGANGPK